MVFLPVRSADASVAQDVGHLGVHHPERFRESGRDFLPWASEGAREQRAVLQESLRWPRDAPPREWSAAVAEPVEELLVEDGGRWADQELGLAE